ncbi:hypothetical protein [Peptostreptococcus faecalis]|uniref:hypothetical protein n=1 Tax=Peptostreptococcus faecalis TaxID=2045015 RepID=UPI0011AF68D7|nr:hypothetical protein [Peptostreptococcus faecalis]
MLHSSFEGDTNKYKTITGKDADIIIRDILNAEILLSTKATSKKEYIHLAKEYFDDVSVLLILGLRATSSSLEDNMEIMRKICNIYNNDRVYIEKEQSAEKRQKASVSKILRDCYAMTYDEIGVRLDRCPAQIRRYISEWDDMPDSIFKKMHDDVTTNMKSTHEKIIEEQNGLLFLRKGKNSKKYIKIDLKESKKSPYREEIITEKEVEEILKKLKKNSCKKSF